MTPTRSPSRPAAPSSTRSRDQLVLQNVGLVRRVVGGFDERHRDDLMQEGMIGLLNAAEKYDPSRGTAFSTYATWWIRVNITRYLREQRGPVKAPLTVPGKRLDPFPMALSLDAPLGADDETTHIDRLVDDADLEADALRADLSVQVQELISATKRLSPLARYIIGHRLSSDEPETLEEIGSAHGLSRERVRQVEKNTKRFLARYLAQVEAA